MATLIDPAKTSAFNKVPLPEKVAFVMETWDTWTKERVNKEAIWLECENAYLSHNDEKRIAQKWKSRAYIPASHSAVENIHAQLMKGAFPVTGFFDVRSVSPGTDVRAQAARELLRNQIRRSQFRAEFSKFLKQLIIIGNSAAMVDWVKEYSGERLVYEGPRLKTLDMRYFHVDPFSSDEFPNVMRRYWMSYEEAKATGLFDKQALLEAKQHAVASASQADANATEKKQAFGLTGTMHRRRGDIEITEFWGTMDIEEGVFENYVVSVANGSKLLRATPSPYANGRHPFVFAKYNPVAGEAYGIGALEPALDLQALINTFTNQKVDELSIIINGLFKYIDDGVIDAEQAEIEPGAWIEVGELDNLQAIHHDRAVSLAYTEIADLEKKFEEATGAIKLVAGGVPSQPRTATETLALTQSGNARFDEILAHLEATAIQPMLELYLQHSAEFMSQETSVRILDSEEERQAWVSIRPEDLAHGYDIVPTGARQTGLREIRLKNLMQYLQIAGSTPQIAQRLDWNKVNQRIWRELGFDDDDTLMMSGDNNVGESIQGLLSQIAGQSGNAGIAGMGGEEIPTATSEGGAAELASSELL